MPVSNLSKILSCFLTFKGKSYLYVLINPLSMFRYVCFLSPCFTSKYMLWFEKALLHSNELDIRYAGWEGVCFIKQQLFVLGICTSSTCVGFYYIAFYHVHFIIKRMWNANKVSSAIFFHESSSWNQEIVWMCSCLLGCWW